MARNRSWRIHEHFDEQWDIDSECNLEDPDHMYRPYGTVPGHSLEWARLLLQLHCLYPEATSWMPDAAAVATGKREAYEATVTVGSVGTLIGGSVGTVIGGGGGKNLVHTIVTASPAYTRVPFTVPDTSA